MRDATSRLAKKSTKKAFQSTHPMRDATHCGHYHVTSRVISIHASHAGCDGDLEEVYRVEHDGISIQASHAGCDV